MYDSKSLSRTLLIVLGIRRKGRESFPDSAIFKLFPRPEWSLILFKFFGCCFLFFKIDVYSFRVLLCEMCTFKQFTDSQKRLAQVNIYGEKQWPAETCAPMSEDKSQGKTRHDRDHKWAEEVTLKPKNDLSEICKFSRSMLPWDFPLFSLICDGWKFFIKTFFGLRLYGII